MQDHGFPASYVCADKPNPNDGVDKKILNLYGQLYSHYEDGYWYWEIIEMLRKVFLCGGLLTVAAGTSFQIVVALLVQFFYILIITRLMPYKHLHDDVVQLIGSVQLFLTLVAGLMLKLLKRNTEENINIAEQENLGILLITINSIIFFACAFAIFLATPCGKKKLYKQVKTTTKITPTVLKEVRKSYGAGSSEYKSALKKVGVVEKSVIKKKGTIML